MNYQNRVAIISGSRNTQDFEPYAVDQLVARLSPRHIVTGCATGVDAAAIRAAQLYRIPHTVCYANWDLFGKQAGMVRNGAMITMAEAIAKGHEQEPPILVSFPGGAGTRGMRERAKLLSIETIVVDRNGNQGDH